MTNPDGSSTVTDHVTTDPQTFADPLDVFTIWVSEPHSPHVLWIYASMDELTIDNLGDEWDEKIAEAKKAYPSARVVKTVIDYEALRVIFGTPTIGTTAPELVG